MKHNVNSTEALEQSKQYKQLIDTCSTKVFLGCNISAEQEVLLSGEILAADGETMHFAYPE